MRAFYIVLIATMTAAEAVAQTMPPRWQAGVHFSVLEQPEFGEKPLGAGGFLTCRISKYLGLDAVVNRYPVGGMGDSGPRLPQTQLQAYQQVFYRWAQKSKSQAQAALGKTTLDPIQRSLVETFKPNSRDEE